MKIIRILTTVRRRLPWITCYRVKLLSIFVLVGLFVTYLHISLLPRSMGYYNNACILNQTQKEDMWYLLRHVTRAFGELNVTYWIDYGTLLGAVRLEDILPHDGDIDIGRFMHSLNEDGTMEFYFTKKMNEVGIKASGMTAKYKTAEADLFRWTFLENSTNGRRFLVKWYPFIPLESLAEKWYNYHFPPQIPVDVILPTKDIRIHGYSVQAPNNPTALLKIRYPFTWFLTFPYKWKCWI